jgi:hypothetical protein
MAPTELVHTGRNSKSVSSKWTNLVMKGHEDGGKYSLEWRKLFLLVVTNRRFPPISLERR